MTDKHDLEAMLRNAGIKFESTPMYTIIKTGQGNVLIGYDEKGNLKKVRR